MKDVRIGVNSSSVLPVILIGAVALRVYFAPGLKGDDDMSLIFSALKFLQHGFALPHDQYDARWGVTLPLALIFRIFGVGLPQVLAIPLAFSLLGILLAYAIGARLFDTATGLIAAGVLALFPLDVEYAGLLFPDLIQGVSLAGSLYLALRSRDSRHGSLFAVGAGICWAYAYYVKIDAFFFVFVLLIAFALGFVRLRELAITGGTCLLLVGVEFGVYAVVAGNPLLHIQIEHLASTEVLAPGLDYRNMYIYPKAMLVTVYETGATFYIFAAAIVTALCSRARAPLLVAGWCLVFLAWLMFGVDPFTTPMRLKPELVRYLLDFAVGAAVLDGWFIALCWRRVSRALTLIGCAAAALIALVLVAFNQLNFEAARATRDAVAAAVANHWFPLYVDLGSSGVASFLLHDSPLLPDVHLVQFHDYLKGTTWFGTIEQSSAYLMLNEDREREQARRNLVTRTTPDQFGMKATEVLSVDNPMPPICYVILRGLAWMAAAAHVPGISAQVHETAREVLLPGDAKVYRLER
jgi:hypothetical protein